VSSSLVLVRIALISSFPALNGLTTISLVSGSCCSCWVVPATAVGGNSSKTRAGFATPPLIVTRVVVSVSRFPGVN